jgi:hypothetical protein
MLAYIISTISINNLPLFRRYNAENNFLLHISIDKIMPPSLKNAPNTPNTHENPKIVLVKERGTAVPSYSTHITHIHASSHHIHTYLLEKRHSGERDH